MTKPFLKWVGGKRQLLPELMSRLPPAFNHYYEPFLGGGALFFALAPLKATLSDINAELVTTYTAIRDNPQGVITALREHRYERAYYYAVRADPGGSPETVAARMIYLNHCGFNGLYRVNSRGLFNVPFGTYKNPTICDYPVIMEASFALQGVTLIPCAFKYIHPDTVSEGDFIYCDPPYVPASPTASFTSYSRGGFGRREQELLATMFNQLTARRVSIMLSNSDTPLVHDLYRGHRIERVEAKRSVNSKGGGRGKVGEVIVRNY
jgi:DNA adenine methylase